jgi:hypothetical protein
LAISSSTKARVLALLGLLIGVLFVLFGLDILRFGHDLGGYRVPLIVGPLIFGALGVYAGASVLRSGRL